MSDGCSIDVRYVCDGGVDLGWDWGRSWMDLWLGGGGFGAGMGWTVLSYFTVSDDLGLTLRFNLSRFSLTLKLNQFELV